MSDPRNVAHKKKVKQEKKHHEPVSADANAKKGRTGKTADVADQGDAVASSAAPAAVAKVEQAPGELEKSMAVLSKLKEMEFHSRANIETLAGLTLTIEDEFHTKIAALIASYEVKCESLKPSA